MREELYKKEEIGYKMAKIYLLSRQKILKLEDLDFNSQFYYDLLLNSELLSFKNENKEFNTIKKQEILSTKTKFNSKFMIKALPIMIKKNQKVFFIKRIY